MMLHTELIPPPLIHRLIWSVGLWLCFVVLWIRVCVWIDSDARITRGSPMPWSLLLALCGLSLLAAPLLLGLNGYTTFLLAPLVVSIAYIWRRDTKLAPDERIAISPRLQQSVLACVRRLPLSAALGKTEADLLRRADEPDVRVTFRDQHGESPPPSQSRRQRRAIDHAILATRSIFVTAFACRARAVHLDPRPDGRVRILYDIDGVTKARKSLTRARGTALAVALKAMAGKGADDVLAPQNGTFTVTCATEQHDFVASTQRNAFGERLDLHVRGEPIAGGLHREGLAAIGLPGRDCESLRWVLEQRRGLLLISGPPRSGRTATGYAAIGEISPLNRSVMTVESAIDEFLPFAMQSLVAPDADRTFPKVLRTVLQQNPDVVFIDEMRDRETAEIAIQAAANCLIIATIQADDAASSLARLLHLGVDAALVQESVTAILAQRLARKLCNICKKPYLSPENFRKKIRRPDIGNSTIYKRKGCDACHRRGYSGLLPITEFLRVDDGVRSMIGERQTSRRIRARARRAGMRTLRESAIALIQTGATSIGEVVRVVP